MAPFLLRLLLLLPLCFAAWYFAAPLLLQPAEWLTTGLLALTLPEAFAAVSIEARSSMLFDTRLVVHTAEGLAGSPVLSLDPLIYAYNLPVLAALILAAPQSRRRLQRLPLAYALLLPAWVWGICFGFAKAVSFDLGPEVSAQIAAPGWWLEGVALGYQFGYLVLPVFALVFAWYVLCRDDVLALSGAVLAPPKPLTDDGRQVRRMRALQRQRRRAKHRSRRTGRR